MDQSKELRALYLKGYMVGNHCNIALDTNVGVRNEDGSYTKLGEKGTIVHAKIKKGDDGVVSYEVVFEHHTVNVPLNEGKIR